MTGANEVSTSAPNTPVGRDTANNPVKKEDKFRRNSTTPIGISKKLKTDPLVALMKPFRIPTPRPGIKREGLARKATRKNINYSDENQGLEFRKLKEEGKQPNGIKRLGTRVVLGANSNGVVNNFGGGDIESILNRKFVTPLLIKPPDMGPPAALGMKRRHDFIPRPLHDPCGEFAIVLYDPTVDDNPVVEIDPNKIIEEKDEEEELIKVPKKKPSLADILGISSEKDKKKIHPKVPVVIDPRLAKVLRPHQVEGVKFLYRCVTGVIQKGSNGCIMADEMGLGKTLQCIALMWTLLKQSPEGGNIGSISKCIIVCPASLVTNWAKELVKWLGEGTITPLALDGRNKSEDLTTTLKQWSIATGRQIVRPVLIVSYETLRNHVDDLRNTEIGLMLCDEGHRLKSAKTLIFNALTQLNVQRRVILSGTPIQNSLAEYFALLTFVNPGVLGTSQEFHKNYETHITRGQDSFATEDQVNLGQAKLKELSLLVSRFIIRRTNDLLTKYLPVKYEHVVFCSNTELQNSLYNKYVSSPEIRTTVSGGIKGSLKAIIALRKLCNHPDLLDLPGDIAGSEEVLPDDFVPKVNRGRNNREVKSYYSGKFMVLERMLARIRRDTNDKIVIISNFTQTLDLVEQLCRERRYGSFRLDGTIPIKKRQKLVDKFNDPEREEFVFLLSSKAGGCGLNLIGANRLILLDVDWNPASDQQALARVWRDGQKKDCFVYRFVATGTMEEKIFQRQTMKQSLSSSVVDEVEDIERLFSATELRQLFRDVDCGTPSETHDTFKCKRCKDGRQLIKSPAMLYGDATTWNHFRRPELSNIEDLLLRQEKDDDVVSFVFQFISH